MEFSEEGEMKYLKRQLMARSTGIMEGCHKGEVRTVNMIYYLSFNGKIDQPHLIRVRINQNGVHLRDVKRWLSYSRGKDMPNSFCWSYKRRYKSEYVWQDLMDGDLITPICDNEYILKGSQFPSSPYPFCAIDTLSCGEKTPSHDLNFNAKKLEAKQVTTPKPMDKMLKVDVEQNVLPNYYIQLGQCSQNHHQNLDILAKKDDAIKINLSSQQEEEQKQPENQEAMSPAIESESEAIEKNMSRRSRRASHVVRDILACRKKKKYGMPLLPINQQKRAHHNFNPFHCVTRMFHGSSSTLES